MIESDYHRIKLDYNFWTFDYDKKHNYQLLLYRHNNISQNYVTIIFLMKITFWKCERTGKSRWIKILDVPDSKLLTNETYFYDDSGSDDKNRILVFTTERNIGSLNKNKNWYGDGKVLPSVISFDTKLKKKFNF